MAHEDGDEHDVYHHDLDAEHDDVHGQLAERHDEDHRRLEAIDERMMARCDGDEWCEWRAQRLLMRMHRVEHRRERAAHRALHNQAEPEHETYHEMTGNPYYGGSGASYRYQRGS